MGESFVLKFKGAMDYKGLYILVREWFTQRHYNFHETKYKSKPDAVGREDEIDFHGELKVNEYVKYTVDIGFHGWALKEVKVQQAGKERDLHEGRIIITLKYSVQDRADEIFRSASGTQSKMQKRMATLIQKLKKREVGFKFEDKLRYDVIALETTIKKFLNMYTDVNTY